MTSTAAPFDADGLTLRDLFEMAAGRHCEREAVIVGGVSYTYRELWGDAGRVAGFLHEQGVTPGTPIALALENCYEYVVADLAIIRVGAAKVPLNHGLSETEKADILADCEPRVVFLSESETGLVATPALQATTVVVVGEPVAGRQVRAWRDVLRASPPERQQRGVVGPDGAGLILYTGGTTGRAKGVVHTQRGLVQNVLSHLVEMELVDDDRLLLTSPLPHSAGFLLHAALVKGAVTFVEQRFDAREVVDLVREVKITYLFLVPTMIYRILDVLEREGSYLPSLRTVLYGAAPITRDRLTQGMQRLGRVFMQLYAQSEAPNFLTRLSKADHARSHLLGSCGRAVAMAQVAVVDEAGARCPPRTVGEVIATSSYVMKEYLRRPEETSEALRDGWLFTGDLGWMDAEGYVFLVDRRKDMIITGGLNVYSVEVENALAAVEGVSQVAVVGTPHHDWGEAVTAFVVPGLDAQLNEDMLRDAAATLSGYKRPKAYQFVDRLPLTAVGKLDKKRLRAQVSDNM